MYVPVVILGVFLWVMVALWPAFIAKKKGYSFVLFFIISLFFWWITLFVTLLMKDKTASPEPAEK
jgi:hypothetical protein